MDETCRAETIRRIMETPVPETVDAALAAWKNGELVVFPNWEVVNIPLHGISKVRVALMCMEIVAPLDIHTTRRAMTKMAEWWMNTGHVNGHSLPAVDAVRAAFRISDERAKQFNAAFAGPDCDFSAADCADAISFGLSAKFYGYREALEMVGPLLKNKVGTRPDWVPYMVVKNNDRR